MIYAGYIHFNSAQDKINKLITAINSLIPTNAKIIIKNSLVLCYGKISDEQDMDDIWENDTSLLLGRVFDKNHNGSFKKEDFKNYADLSKKAVLEKIWGKYVYINLSNSTQLFEIVLDSTGQLPFFYYPFPDGNILFSSDIEVIFKVLSQKPEYNLEYLCSYIVHGTSSAIQTPFKNIYELPPACSLQITKIKRTTTAFWNPLNSYKTSEKQKKDAVDVLQSTLKPWIAPYKDICVSLSGGLDSSALVYCLKDLVRKDQSLKALNYFHSQIQSSNELEHARKVCNETNIELIEIDTSHSLPFDPPHRNLPLMPNKPFPGLVSLRWLETIFDNIPQTSSYTFLSGHGSDHIFMRPPSKKSVTDYFLEKGFKGLEKELKNIAQFYRDPMFAIAKENLLSLVSYFFASDKGKRPLNKTNDETPNWIKQELLHKASPNYVHPIYEDLPRKVIPGKYDQIDNLYEGINSIHVELMDQISPTHYPFLYEPVVEFALSFPTYELFDNGYDRYPLRKAVGDRFNTETAWRRDKSQTTGLFQLGIKQNLEYILEICLEGYFVKQGLVNKEGLHKTITLIGNGDTKHLWPFMYLASIEIFLKLWNEKNL